MSITIISNNEYYNKTYITFLNSQNVNKGLLCFTKLSQDDSTFYRHRIAKYIVQSTYNAPTSFVHGSTIEPTLLYFIWVHDLEDAKLVERRLYKECW